MRIREWRDREAELILYSKGSAKKKRKLGPGRSPYSLAMDQALYDYLDEERAAGRVMHNKDIAAKARQIAPNHNMPETFKVNKILHTTSDII